MSILCDAIRRDVLDASSEGFPDDGRDSAYALEGSQAIEESENPKDLIQRLSNDTHYETNLDGITKVRFNAAEESTQQSVDFSGDRVIIDPNLINPPQFIERNGKLFVTSVARPEATSREFEA